MRELLAALIVIAVGACTPNGTPQRSDAVVVLDSAMVYPPWHLLADSARVYRVRLSADSLTREVTNVVTPFPSPAGASSFIGLLWHPTSADEAERLIVRWNLATGRVDSLPIPEDAWYVANDIIASPDGRFIAYAGSDSTGTFAMIRTFPDLRPLMRLAGGGGCDCDVDLNHVRWFAPDSFEVAIAHVSSGNGWLIARGRASAGRARIDTVASEPAWH